jgi:hypothetical protein
MVKLPVLQSKVGELTMMQTRWASLIEPVLSQPFNNGVLLQEVELSTGTNKINHKLGRKPQGWVVVDRNTAATVYRSAPFNALTLTLTASAGVTVSLHVF